MKITNTYTNSSSSPQNKDKEIKVSKEVEQKVETVAPVNQSETFYTNDGEVNDIIFNTQKKVESQEEENNVDNQEKDGNHVSNSSKPFSIGSSTTSVKNSINESSSEKDKEKEDKEIVSQQESEVAGNVNDNVVAEEEYQKQVAYKEEFDKIVETRLYDPKTALSSDEAFAIIDKQSVDELDKQKIEDQVKEFEKLKKQEESIKNKLVELRITKKHVESELEEVQNELSNLLGTNDINKCVEIVKKRFQDNEEMLKAFKQEIEENQDIIKAIEEELSNIEK